MRSEAQTLVTLVYGEVMRSDLTGNIWKPFPLLLLLSWGAIPQRSRMIRSLAAEVGRNPRAQDGELYSLTCLNQNTVNGCQLFNMVQHGLTWFNYVQLIYPFYQILSQLSQLSQLCAVSISNWFGLYRLGRLWWGHLSCILATWTFAVAAPWTTETLGLWRSAWRFQTLGFGRFQAVPGGCTTYC